MHDPRSVPRTRAARLRRHLLALADAAGRLLREDTGSARGFGVVTAAALQALGIERVSLWEAVGDERLECRAVVPASTAHAGLGRPADRAPRVLDLATASGPLPGWADELRAGGACSLLDVPVLIAGQPWGRMLFEAHVPRSWRADELATARHFADVFAISLERERRREAEARLAYLQMYDDASGVANRALFLANLRQCLKRLRRPGGPAASALLFVDIDRFHSVNEFFGEAGGNAALAAVAARLDAATPADALIGRLESDCFGVLLPDPGPEWRVPPLAERVLAAVGEPIVQDGRSWEASASIGIAFADAAAGFSVEEWLRNADLASKEAKQAGRNRLHVFDPDHHQSLLLRLEIERGLRDALRDGRIEVAYQAEFDLDTGAIVGAEALARWRRPGGALVAAGEFIEVAEATGLIEPIGRVVLQSACREALRWPPAADGAPRSVRVNVSARQFTQSTLVQDVADALAATGLDPARLCLEITETTVMAKAGESMQTLQALKALGLCLAIDDFGTGYSSLSYLKRFPVDVLKLDKSMVDGVECDDTVRAILRAVQGLACSLQLEVVVEGVEDASQEQPLRAMGIHRVQGFLYARPEPAEAFRARL